MLTHPHTLVRVVISNLRFLGNILMYKQTLLTCLPMPTALESLDQLCGSPQFYVHHDCRPRALVVAQQGHHLGKSLTQRVRRCYLFH